MIRIEQKPYGYKLIYSGLISIEGIQKWLKESEELFENAPESFGVLVDMQKMEILPVNCQSAMLEGQKLYKKMGMLRSVVIVKDKLTAMQFRLMAQKTGIYENERYINAADNQNWEKDGLNWILNSVEPEVEKELAK